MQLSRRSFLGGVLALSAATLVVPRLPLPRIVGDGIHDDAPGLNALLCGDPVSIEASGITLSSEGNCLIRNGCFRMSGPLHIPKRIGKVELRNSELRWESPQTDHLIVNFEFDPTVNSVLEGAVFIQRLGE
jgi:hypothetical protein